MQTNQNSTPPHRTSRWLLLIAAFKLAQAALFALVGVGALRLLGKDVGDELMHLVDALHFNPESKLVNFLAAQADRVDDHLLRRIGAVVFIYAALDMAEGIGLAMEKVWAEYLTLLITASFLPLEIYELWERVTWLRGSLLTVNILVLVYLLRLIVCRKQTVV